MGFVTMEKLRKKLSERIVTNIIDSNNYLLSDLIYVDHT